MWGLLPAEFIAWLSVDGVWALSVIVCGTFNLKPLDTSGNGSFKGGLLWILSLGGSCRTLVMLFHIGSQSGTGGFFSSYRSLLLCFDL